MLIGLALTVAIATVAGGCLVVGLLLIVESVAAPAERFVHIRRHRAPPMVATTVPRRHDGSSSAKPGSGPIWADLSHSDAGEYELTVET